MPLGSIISCLNDNIDRILSLYPTNSVSSGYLCTSTSTCVSISHVNCKYIHVIVHVVDVDMDELLQTWSEWVSKTETEDLLWSFYTDLNSTVSFFNFSQKYMAFFLTQRPAVVCELQFFTFWLYTTTESSVFNPSRMYTQVNLTNLT